MRCGPILRAIGSEPVPRRSRGSRVSVRRSAERAALDAAPQRRPAAVVDARSARAACRTRSSATTCALLPLLSAASDATVCDSIRCDGPLYERLIHPLLLAALNIDPQRGLGRRWAPRSCARRSLAGGAACRPLIARDGLGPAFIEPALRHLEERNVAGPARARAARAALCRRPRRAHSISAARA